MKKESDTEKSYRVLLLWLDLNKAIAQARPADLNQGLSMHPPWTSGNANVQETWRRLTDPENLLALEQWLYQSADGQTADWAFKALEVCRERKRKTGNGGRPAPP